MIDNALLAKAQRRMKARASKSRGSQIEFVVAHRLRSMGFEMVEPIHSGFKKLAGRWVPCQRVSGDFRALAPGGVSVLVESKYRPDRLVFSDLEQHQVAALDLHARHGGMSFLAWSHHADGPLDVVLLRWPVTGFGPGQAITAANVLDRALRWRP